MMNTQDVESGSFLQQCENLQDLNATVRGERSYMKRSVDLTAPVTLAASPKRSRSETPVAAPTLKPSHDRNAFYERLETFSAAFVGRSRPVSAVECAKHGFYDTHYIQEKHNICKLSCTSCKCDNFVIDVTDYERNLPKKIHKIREQYLGGLYNLHSPECFWRFDKCADDIYVFPIQTSTEAIDLVKTEGSRLLSFPGHLPPVQHTLTSAQLTKLDMVIRGSEHLTSFKPVVPDLPDSQRTPYIYALYGWRLSLEIAPSLKCHHCFKRVAISAQLQFNVVGEHMEYCPWVNVEQAMVRKPFGTLSFVPGYEWMIAVMEQEYSFMFYMREKSEAYQEQRMNFIKAYRRQLQDDRAALERDFPDSPDSLPVQIPETEPVTKDHVDHEMPAAETHEPSEEAVVPTTYELMPFIVSVEVSEEPSVPEPTKEPSKETLDAKVTEAALESPIAAKPMEDITKDIDEFTGAVPEKQDVTEPTDEVFEEPVAVESSEAVSEESGIVEPAEQESEKPTYSERTKELFEEPVESVSEKPVIVEPVEEVSEKPIIVELVEEISEKPLVAEPVEEVSETPVDETLEQPVSVESVEETSEKPVITKPLEDVSEEPVSMEPVNDVSEQPADEEVEKPGIAAPTEEVTEEPSIFESTDEPALADSIESEKEAIADVTEVPTIAEPTEEASKETAAAEVDVESSEQPVIAEPTEELVVSEEPVAKISSPTDDISKELTSLEDEGGVEAFGDHEVVATDAQEVALVSTPTINNEKETELDDELIDYMEAELHDTSAQEKTEAAPEEEIDDSIFLEASTEQVLEKPHDESTEEDLGEAVPTADDDARSVSSNNAEESKGDVSEHVAPHNGDRLEDDREIPGTVSVSPPQHENHEAQFNNESDALDELEESPHEAQQLETNNDDGATPATDVEQDANTGLDESANLRAEVVENVESSQKAETPLNLQPPASSSSQAPVVAGVLEDKPSIADNADEASMGAYEEDIDMDGAGENGEEEVEMGGEDDAMSESGGMEGMEGMEEDRAQLTVEDDVMMESRS